MSLMDFFRGANPVPAAVPAPATNGNPPVPAPTDKSPGGNAPVADPNAPIEPSFDKLWDPVGENDPKLPDFNPSALFQFDPAKVQEAVKQIDYTKAMNSEQLQAVVAGGEGAMAALSQIMNSVAQQATQVSMIGSAKLIEQALGKANESLDARMAEQIRKQEISAGLREKNPIFNSPEFSPMVSALETQFRTKYPNASSAEITTMAEKYVLKFAQGITGKKDADSASKVEEVDWENLFLS